MGGMKEYVFLILFFIMAGYDRTGKGNKFVSKKLLLDFLSGRQMTKRNGEKFFQY